MSWAEIKKAVNSDISTPLNDMLESVMVHKNSQTFTSSGNFTVPNGVTVIFVTAIASGGGGGGGGGGTNSSDYEASLGENGGNASPTLIGDYLTIPGGEGGAGGSGSRYSYVPGQGNVSFGGNGGNGGFGAIGGNPGSGGNAAGDRKGSAGSAGVGTYENGKPLTTTGTRAGGTVAQTIIHDNTGSYIPNEYGRGGNGGAGGPGNAGGGGGGAGGSGQFVLNAGIKVTPGETILITIGEPGTGGSGGTGVVGTAGSSGTKGVVIIQW